MTATAWADLLQTWIIAASVATTLGAWALARAFATHPDPIMRRFARFFAWLGVAFLVSPVARLVAPDIWEPVMVYARPAAMYGIHVTNTWWLVLGLRRD